MHLLRRPSTLGQSGTSIRAWQSVRWGLAPSLAFAGLLLWGVAHPDAARNRHEQAVEFDMVRSAGLPTDCVPQANGEVRIESKGPVEVMTVKVDGLPPNTDFDFFVIQKPGGPFGMSWYQGDIETNKKGQGQATFIGRFNIETFIVAPGAVPAPTPHGAL